MKIFNQYIIFYSALFSLIFCVAIVFLYAGFKDISIYQNADLYVYTSGAKIIYQNGISEANSFDKFGRFPEYFLPYFYFISGFIYPTERIILIMNTALTQFFILLSCLFWARHIKRIHNLDTLPAFLIFSFLVNQIPVGISHQLTRQAVAFFIVTGLLSSQRKAFFVYSSSILMGLLTHVTSILTVFYLLLIRQNLYKLFFLICIFFLLGAYFFGRNYVYLTPVFSFNKNEEIDLNTLMAFASFAILSLVFITRRSMLFFLLAYLLFFMQIYLNIFAFSRFFFGFTFFLIFLMIFRTFGVSPKQLIVMSFLTFSVACFKFIYIINNII